MTVSIDTTSQDTLRDTVRESAAAVGPSILELSHKVHALAEISWEEHDSAAAVAAVLRDGGFEVTERAYDVPTAIEAVYGTGELTVVICAEYDALPEVGHACGHNMIAAAGVGAALALKPVADAAGLRIKLLGTPAEEHGGGKVSLLQAGAWEDAAFSLMVHGMTGAERSAAAIGMAAVERFEVQFKGSEAHAAGAPDKAINAGAAASLALMNMAVLRQHLPENANTNAFISHGGGATNVIAGDSTVQVEVRAGDVDVGGTSSGASSRASKVRPSPPAAPGPTSRPSTPTPRSIPTSGWAKHGTPTWKPSEGPWTRRPSSGAVPPTWATFPR
jgi:amidohydrolase